VWRARYEHHAKDRTITWEVDTDSRECPVALISPESLRLVSQFFEARRVQKLGGVLHGSDGSRWPARWWDAVNLIQLEIEKEESAANKAIHSQG
jgi:hypothetical protein